MNIIHVRDFSFKLLELCPRSRILRLNIINTGELGSKLLMLYARGRNLRLYTMHAIHAGDDGFKRLNRLR